MPSDKKTMTKRIEKFVWGKAPQYEERYDILSRTSDEQLQAFHDLTLELQQSDAYDAKQREGLANFGLFLRCLAMDRARAAERQGVAKAATLTMTSPPEVLMEAAVRSGFDECRLHTGDEEGMTLSLCIRTSLSDRVQKTSHGPYCDWQYQLASGYRHGEDPGPDSNIDIGRYPETSRASALVVAARVKAAWTAEHELKAKLHEFETRVSKLETRRRAGHEDV